MEEVKTDPVDQTQVASGAEENQPEEKQDVVAYDSYKKLLNEKKNAQERLRQLMEQKEQELQARLVEEGRIKEALEIETKKRKESEEKLRATNERFAWEKLTGNIKAEALKAGCLNPDKLIKLLDKQDFETLKTEDGEVRAESLNQLIEKAKRENDFLFKKASVNVNDVTPSPGVPKMEKTETELFEDYVKNLT